MAKSFSLFNLSGTIGDLTFSQRRTGIVAGEKPGPSSEKVLNHESFERTRRNAGEFRLAIKNATVLRRALGAAIDGVRHPLLSGMMNKLLHQVASHDRHHASGARQAAMGNASLFSGFDFNPALLLENALPVKCQHALNLRSGTMGLELPSFIARRKKTFPQGATHFRIISCGAVVNFFDNGYDNSIKSSELLPLGKKTPDGISFEHSLPVAPGEVLLQVMGIAFYKIVNREEQLVKGGAVRILEAQQMEQEKSMQGELHQSAEETPMDGEGKNTLKPFTAKVLKEMGGLFIKNLPHRKQKPLANDPSTEC